MVDSKSSWKAWIYLSPAILLLLVFTAWPIVNTIRMSLLEGYSSMGAAGGMQYAFGIGNFKQVLEYTPWWSDLYSEMMTSLGKSQEEENLAALGKKLKIRLICTLLS